MIEPYKESWINRRSIVVLIATLGVVVAAGVFASRKRDELRRCDARAAKYEALFDLLGHYRPQNPLKKQYVRELADYYRRLAEKYRSARLHPWRDVEPDLEAPRRPEELAGAPDPRTGAIPEIAEARAASVSHLPWNVPD